jgi:hypothetical protein
MNRFRFEVKAIPLLLLELYIFVVSGIPEKRWSIFARLVSGALGMI